MILFHHYQFLNTKPNLLTVVLFFNATSRLYDLEPSAALADQISKMSIVKGKSSDAISYAKEAVEMEEEWEPFDFGWEPTFVEKLENSVEAPIEEVVRYSGKRRVTLMELVGALEEARDVATERERRSERLKGLRKKREKAIEEASKNMGENIHNDNPVLYKEKVWDRMFPFIIISLKPFESFSSIKFVNEFSSNNEH